MNETMTVTENTTNIRAIKRLSAVIITIFMVVTVAFQSSSALAASVKAPTMKSVAAKSSSSVTVKWKKVSKVKGYVIYQKTGSGKYKKVATVSGGSKVSYTKKGLKAATKYSYKVKAYKTKSGKKVYSGYSKVKSTYTKPATPTNVKATAKSETSIKVSWKKVSKAKGYVIYRKSDGEYEKIATVTSGKTTSYTVKNLKVGKSYTYAVRAYFKPSGSKVYSAYSKTAKTSTKSHSYKKTVCLPTCTNQGYTLHKCSCGASYKTDYTAPKHNFADYVCCECGEVDKSNAYEYLKQWVLDNGEASGEFVRLDIGQGHRLYYNANGDYIYLTDGYYNSYDDFYFASLYLHNLSYFASIGDNVYNDYVEGYVNGATFHSNAPLPYTNYNSTYYTTVSLSSSVRESVCAMLEQFEIFLEENNLGITIADLGFTAYY